MLTITVLMNVLLWPWASCPPCSGTQPYRQALDRPSVGGVGVPAPMAIDGWALLGVLSAARPLARRGRV